MSDKEEETHSTPKKATLDDIWQQVCKNGKQLATVTTNIEEIQGMMHELKIENDKLKREVATLKEIEEKLKEQLAEVKHTAKVALERANDTDQYSRRNNIRIYGLKEKQKGAGGEEGGDDTEEQVLKLFSTMQLKVKAEDLEAAHRLGAKNPDKNTSRGVIVRFINRKQKENAIKNRRKLKNTGVVVVEDLTDVNYKLLQRVKSDPLCENAWTINGKVTMKTKSGRIVKVHSTSHLEEQRAHWAKKPGR
jgi:regulator of replication initiation timing